MERSRSECVHAVAGNENTAGRTLTGYGWGPVSKCFKIVHQTGRMKPKRNKGSENNIRIGGRGVQVPCGTVGRRGKYTPLNQRAWRE